MVIEIRKVGKMKLLYFNYSVYMEVIGATSAFNNHCALFINSAPYEIRIFVMPNRVNKAGHVGLVKYKIIEQLEIVGCLQVIRTNK
jgi:hypothetical protein